MCHVFALPTSLDATGMGGSGVLNVGAHWTKNRWFAVGWAWIFARVEDCGFFGRGEVIGTSRYRGDKIQWATLWGGASQSFNLGMCAVGFPIWDRG